MEKFENFEGKAALLDRANVDTDQIIPKQFLTRTDRSGYGDVLFHDWRFLPGGEENPDFELNQHKFRDAAILVSGDNFGCGSSREHALWALTGYGFRVVVATGFADIFFNNAIKNGLLPARVVENDLRAIKESFLETDATKIQVDLQSQKLVLANGTEVPFDIDPLCKRRLLDGVDPVSQTLDHLPQLQAFEEQYRQRNPWYFQGC